MRAIQRAVARSAHVPLSAIAGRCRRREHAHARQLAMWLAYHLRADMSYPALGRLFGGRDHTTIMYGVAQTAARVGARTPGDVWRDINRGSVESGNQGMA